MPAQHRQFIETWRQQMPDWPIMAWTDADIDWSVRYLQQAYATRGWNRISNYMRMHALNRYGGFYLDTDIELLKPLDPLREERAVLGFQVAEPSDSWVNGAVFGAEPGHPFVRRLLRAFHEEMPGWRRMGDSHGPGLITRLLRDEGLSRCTGAPQHVAGVTLMPVDRFYPYHWTESFTPACITPNTFAVHHWEHGWGGQRPLTARETLRALAAATMPGPAAALARRRIASEKARRAGPGRGAQALDGVEPA
ncbi:glycosyltransferase [Falsiroseomonas sp. HW251]|uniref:glycosyltransferase n=1 Tax=Falsiroseomonas sp. HW251 TaxID=3390998 RepID=UPI003D31A6F5